jgi:hypothetical protein
MTEIKPHKDGLTACIFALIPAKAGIQIHPDNSVGFTWFPAFAGMSAVESIGSVSVVLGMR